MFILYSANVFTFEDYSCGFERFMDAVPDPQRSYIEPFALTLGLFKISAARTTCRIWPLFLV